MPAREASRGRSWGSLGETLTRFLRASQRCATELTEWDTYGAYGDARQLAKTTRNQPPPEDQPLPDLDAHEEASAMSPEPLSAVTTSPQTTQYGSGF